MELVLQDRPTAQGPDTAAPEGSAGLCSLGERWDKLMQEAEARWVQGPGPHRWTGTPKPLEQAVSAGVPKRGPL